MSPKSQSHESQLPHFPDFSGLLFYGNHLEKLSKR